jgi:hypothetical protein
MHGPVARCLLASKSLAKVGATLTSKKADLPTHMTRLRQIEAQSLRPLLKKWAF